MRCNAKTSKGSRCKAHAMKGSKNCLFHSSSKKARKKVRMTAQDQYNQQFNLRFGK